MLSRTSEFCFLLDKRDFEKDFDNFQRELADNCTHVFDRFSNTGDLCNYLIQPILANENAVLPNVGADWAFEYLTLARIKNAGSYEKLKSVIKRQVKLLNERGEPNIIEYYPKLDEIISFLERQELES